MLEKCLRDATMLWATIDPIGTMALFVAVTASCTAPQRRVIALRAILYGGGILIGCIVIGQFVLDAMEVGLPALKIAGGIILFLFGLQMLFGPASESNPENQPDNVHDLAVFPLAVPSIASPGAIMAAIMLTDNNQFTVAEQTMTGIILTIILVITYALMMAGSFFYRFLGRNGAAILVRLMGMLLAALSVEMTVNGIADEIKNHSPPALERSREPQPPRPAHEEKASHSP